MKQASCLVDQKIRNTGHQEYINRLKLEVGGCFWLSEGALKDTLSDISFRAESISNRLVEGKNSGVVPPPGILVNTFGTKSK